MGVQIPTWEGAILRGGRCILLYYCKVYGNSAAICANMAELIEMLFGLWPWMGCRNHALDRGPAVLRDVAMAINVVVAVVVPSGRGPASSGPMH